MFQNHKEDLHYKRKQASSATPVSPAAVISKPATWQDDEDVFSTLLKYEKEVGLNDYLWVNLIKFFLRCELRRRRRSILRSRRRQWAWEEEPAWSNLRNPQSRWEMPCSYFILSKQSSFLGNAIGRTKRYKSAVSRGQRIG